MNIAEAEAKPPERLPAITMPPDALVLLVGPAGSGKTTFAHRIFQPDEILSSDEFRAMVSGDPADQSATPAAFRLLHAAADERLRRGLLTVIDATNVLHASREPLLDGATRHGRPAVAVVFAMPVEQCLAWNAARPGRIVPPGVVRRQHRQMRRAVSSLPREGFSAVVILDGVSDLESVSFVGPPERNP